MVNGATEFDFYVDGKHLGRALVVRGSYGVPDELQEDVTHVLRKFSMDEQKQTRGFKAGFFSKLVGEITSIGSRLYVK